MDYPFQYRGDRLFAEDIDLGSLAEKIETPFYLYSKAELKNNCKTAIRCGKGFDFTASYALKANYNPALLKIIREAGMGADIVSGGELYFAQKAGFPLDKIVFAGVGKTIPELQQAINAGIASINVESYAELIVLARLAERLQKKVSIAVRVNPDIDAHVHEYISTGMHQNKFGVIPDEALRLYRLAAEHPWLNPDGLHIHIGSQITDFHPFVDASRFLYGFVTKLREQGIHIKTLDIGGGIGINYENAFDNPKNPRTYLTAILPQMLHSLKDLKVRFVAELGRSIIGSAGILITRVILAKDTPVKRFVIVDSAMNNLIRPSLYHARHEIIPIQRNVQEKTTVDVVGPICESGDFFAKDYPLQAVEEGDLLGIGAAGAYGQALASNYNLRPSIAEYLVDGNTVEKIFTGNSVEDLARLYERK